MKTYVEIGHCSACEEPAKRDAQGAWCHVGPSCIAAHVQDPEVTFVTANQSAKQEAPATEERAQVAADADRAQPAAPRDRQLKASRSNR